MREHRHGVAIGEKELEMIADEDARALLSVHGAGEALLEPLEDGLKRVLLDEVEELLFAVEVMVEAGERCSACARQIAHGGTLVSLLGEYARGAIEYLGHATV